MTEASKPGTGLGEGAQREVALQALEVELTAGSPSTALNTVQAAPGAEAKAESGALGFSPWLPEIHLGSPTNSRMHSTHPDRRNPSLMVWPGLQWLLKLHPGLPLHQPQVIQMCCQGGKLLSQTFPFKMGMAKEKRAQGPREVLPAQICASPSKHTQQVCKALIAPQASARAANSDKGVAGFLSLQP